MDIDATGGEGSSLRRFEYSDGGSHWWRYFAVGIGLAFLCFVLMSSGVDPLSGFWFPFLVILVVMDASGNAFARKRAPKAFQVQGDILRIEWPDEFIEVPVDEVSVRRGLSRLLNSGLVLRAGERTFVVFDDMRGYREFVSLCK